VITLVRLPEQIRLLDKFKLEVPHDTELVRNSGAVHASFDIVGTLMDVTKINSALAFALEQYINRACAAIVWRCGAEGEYIVTLGQPAIDHALEYRSAMG